MRTRGWLECCVYFRGNKKDTTTLTLYQYCYRISRPEVFLKVDLLKTLGKFPQKTLVMKYINNNVASIPLPIFFKVDLTTSVFLRVFQKFQDTYSVESLGATVSVDTLKHIQVINLVFSLMSSLHKKKSFLLVISSVNSKKEKETQQYSPSKETMFVAQFTLNLKKYLDKENFKMLKKKLITCTENGKKIKLQFECFENVDGH